MFISNAMTGWGLCLAPTHTFQPDYMSAQHSRQSRMVHRQIILLMLNSRLGYGTEIVSCVPQHYIITLRSSYRPATKCSRHLKPEQESAVGLLSRRKSNT